MAISPHSRFRRSDRDLGAQPLDFFRLPPDQFGGSDREFVVTQILKQLQVNQVDFGLKCHFIPLLAFGHADILRSDLSNSRTVTGSPPPPR
jgi:hypothetical protein